jgi:hypothetical protein
MVLKVVFPGEVILIRITGPILKQALLWFF